MFPEKGLQYYATLVCGRAGPSGEVEISNAGHPPGLWIKKDGIDSITATGLPLGAFCDEHFKVKRIILERGDVLFFYSDGLPETRSETGVEYGQWRISEQIRKSRLLSSSEIIKACLDDLSAFRGGRSHQDDLTIMAIRRRGHTS